MIALGSADGKSLILAAIADETGKNGRQRSRTR
jgi:hypothetical protein